MTITTLAVGSPNPFAPAIQAVDQSLVGGGEMPTEAPVPQLDSLALSIDAWRLAQTQGGRSFPQDFLDLGRLIQSGNLEGARQAYSTVSALLQGRPASASEQAFLAGDFASLGQALASGDLAASGSAWSALGATLEAYRPRPYPSPSPVFAVGAYLQQVGLARG